jgi:DNA-binding GntR family transcriptional regulator
MSLSTDDPRPPYVQVADVLRSEIEAGDYRPGQKLPSMRDLSERFGVATMTVSSALRVLRDGGFVASTPGRGTFVREREGQEAPDLGIAELAERITSLDATVRDLSERLERLEAKS